MAPTKMEQNAIKARCASVKKAVEHAEDCPDRVKKMLANTLALTIGTAKADRHPFNERFVAMVEQVLESEQGRLTREVAANEAAFNETTPAKANREATLEQAKAVAADAGAALTAAKNAVTEIGAAVKAAAAELAETIKAQEAGDEEMEGITVKKTKLEDTVRDSLTPVVAGEVEIQAKAGHVHAVLNVGRSFGFDTSLMSTAGQVLQRPAAERGGFDATCLQQLQDAFSNEIAKFDGELAAGAPGKAARAAAVAEVDAKKQAAEASQVDLKEKAAAAKEAKAAADAAAKGAAKSLADFMPDLKAAGDALDNAKHALQAFIDGPRAKFSELKEFKEGDFKPIPKPKKVVEEVAEGDAAAAEAPQEESPSKRARTE